MNNFNESNFYQLCDKIGQEDNDLKNIILAHGYPPFWSREPCFATLIHIILEQQVSLVSANSAFKKLQFSIGVITPEKILALSDIEMKACYFSRQKTSYARNLAEAVLSKRLNLENLENETDDTVKKELKKITGIGEWTVDVYMMMALHRADCFPSGDIALVKSLEEIKKLPRETVKTQIINLSNSWKPYRTIAAYLLWHAYLAKREKRDVGNVEPPAS